MQRKKSRAIQYHGLVRIKSLAARKGVIKFLSHITCWANELWRTRFQSMCNLYSVTKGQAAIIEFVRAVRDTTGNLQPMPCVFPDYLAPIVRNAPDGVRELMLARWGMPGPPQFGGAPITNIRNTKSAHWRAWLKPEHS